MKNPNKKIRSFVLYPLKFHLKIKLAFCLFTILFYEAQGSTNSADTRITLNLQNVSVEKVLKEIESKTEFKIMYNDNQVDYKRQVTVNYVDVAVADVMSDLFSGTPVRFEFMGSQIILTRYEPLSQKKNLLSNQVPAQQEISGTVTDSNGSPIPGVSVVEKNTTNGTATDFDGNYVITTGPNATLIFSALGFATQAIPINQQVTVNVTLEEDSQALDEVVVTALGIKQETRKLGYAVAQVDADEVNVNRSSNFMNSLQGKVAGVNVSALGTGPGGSSKVRIRGQSSISGTNNPLIVVNGVPIDNTSFGTNIGSSGSSGELGTSEWRGNL